MTYTADKPKLVPSSDELRERIPHLDCRSARAQRIVLVRDRHAEHRHHRVADELLHRAAVPFDHEPDLLEVAAHRAPHRLRVEQLAECGRPCHVAEDDGHRLADVAPGRPRPELRAAGAAKAEPFRILLAAGLAGRHGLSLIQVSSVSE